MLEEYKSLWEIKCDNKCLIYTLTNSITELSINYNNIDTKEIEKILKQIEEDNDFKCNMTRDIYYNWIKFCIDDELFKVSIFVNKRDTKYYLTCDFFDIPIDKINIIQILTKFLDCKN